MVLCHLLLLLLREVLWVAFCCAVLASFVLVCIEERGKSKEEAAGDDRSRSELERSGGGEERCDLGGLGIGDGVEVGDEGEVFDECPERGGGLGSEGVRVLEPGEDGVKEKNMDASDGGVCERSSGDGGADGLNVGVGVLEMSGDVKGQGVGDGAGFEEKKLVEDNGEVVEAQVLNGRQATEAKVSNQMEACVAGAVRALERYESVEGGGDGGETNGDVVHGESRGFREADTGKRSLVEDDAEKKKLNEDELDEKKKLIDDENEGVKQGENRMERLVEDGNERVVQGETEMKKSDEDENQESFEDLVDNERLVEDDHGNNLSTELDDDDDDWEGIERTELEKRFGAAVAYVGRNENEECLSKLSSIVKVQLYGLHKVATQGPCAESQPSIFQVSARSNWNAWRQVGDKSPEEAMEKYIALLSESVNNWMEDDIAGTSTD